LFHLRSCSKCLKKYLAEATVQHLKKNLPIAPRLKHYPYSLK